MMKRIAAIVGLSLPGCGGNGDDEEVAGWTEMPTRWLGAAPVVIAEQEWNQYEPRVSLDADGRGVAVDPAGRALTVWTKYDGTAFRIWSDRYE